MFSQQSINDVDECGSCAWNSFHSQCTAVRITWTFVEHKQFSFLSSFNYCDGFRSSQPSRFGIRAHSMGTSWMWFNMFIDTIFYPFIRSWFWKIHSIGKYIQNLLTNWLLLEIMHSMYRRFNELIWQESLSHTFFRVYCSYIVCICASAMQHLPLRSNWKILQLVTLSITIMG